MTRTKPRYQPGDRIGGRYQVHQALLGGMGEVYLCLDLEQNYPYALKTFQQRYQSTALRRAFEQEVAIWVTLEKHPNIVRCFHMDIIDNQPFMVLEWIAGEDGKGADLRGWLRHGPLDLKTALEITIDVVRGLLHAQEKQPGLVHRDLKPENILVAQGGLAKITDFGLAQIVESAGLEFVPEENSEEARLSRENRSATISIVSPKSKIQNRIAGTPAYMAPEQWRGEALDERTDIYAVGCMLYEMLAGRWPFQADFRPATPQQFQQWLSVLQHGHESTPAPALPVELPGELGDVVEACLAKAAGDRPAGLSALLEQLSKVYERQFDQPPPRPQAAAFSAGDYNNRGNTYAALQRYEAALADYGRAIDFDPSYAQAYSNRGITYADLQRYDEALADYGRAIDLDPSAQAYSNRGNTYAALQRYDEALADYGRAIDLDPFDAQVYFNLGVLLANTGLLQESLPYFEQAARLGFSQAQHAIVQVRQMLGEAAPEPQPDPAQAALEAFAQAQSPADMEQVVAYFPFLLEPEVVAWLEQFIAQEAPPEDRPYFKERLGWLRQVGSTTD